jgi:hypothetical protein
MEAMLVVVAACLVRTGPAAPALDARESEVAAWASRRGLRELARAGAAVAGLVLYAGLLVLVLG